MAADVLSGTPLARAQNLADAQAQLSTGVVRIAALLLQFLLPTVLLFTALGAWTLRRKRQRLLAQTEARASAAPLLDLSWRDFEQLVGAHFEREGYSVEFTPSGADGGVDVIARKRRETFLVQCKQWRATVVGVSVVRELFGVMAAEGATGAFVVSIGSFSQDAIDFARGRNISLVDAHELLKSSNTVAHPASEPRAARFCPKCGAPMVRRTARQGSRAGQSFLGCGRFPACRHILPDQGD